ncbi:PIG-L family deacetylase [Amycolatopsis roodepoortensis]|uniref:PIG-L deacetylase family protein n=1 Tax=Amycolatopsis roodepoortensis TaxID=700274 RepID=UPI00214ADCE9|nr:PIG-L family deacetylase [Amycolatopsis roodepoortensis]UUV34780.1 PIG-L family deacetylase [Amycolatopsis roodepoortensis]
MIPRRLLAISPHLDDAVLSLGASLAQAALDGAEVLVYTVFAGTAPPPYSAAAERMHAVWGLSPEDDAPLHRRNEDIAALAHLGLAYRHGRFLDSIYRRLPDGRWLTDHVEGGQKLAVAQDSPGDDGLVAEIRDDIEATVAEFEPTLIVTCAAVVDHPDNLATRDAALAAFSAARAKNVPIRLWEDLPYSMFNPGTIELPAGFRLGTSEFESATTETWKRKREAVECYSSQLAMLNGRNKNLFARLDEHARKNSPRGGFGETTWPVLLDENNG